MLDPATGRTTAVTSGAPTDGDPAWSPDGALLAFTRDGEVFQVALDGSVPRRVASGRDPAWAGGAIVLSGEGAEICLAAAHALSRITYRTTGAANLEPTVADASATAALAARPAPPGPLPPACADPPDPTIQVGGTHVPSGPKQVVSYESQLANRGGATASAWVVQEVRGHVRMLELRSSRGFCRRVETTTRVECYTGPIPPARTGTVVVRFRPLEPVPASNLALYADPGITYPSFGLFDCAIGGTEGNDVLTGTDRKEVMCGFGGEDRLFGGGGDDSLDGGAGDDRLDGGVGDDRIVDRVGANVFVGGPGRDRLEGGPANDTFYARDGRRDLVYGYAGFDRARVDPGILDSVYSVERVF